MKIIYFYQYFGTPKGSWSTRVYELSRRWVEAGHQVTVVTAPYDKSDIKAQGFISKQEIEKINLIVIDSGDSNRLPKVKRVLRALIFALTSMSFALTQKYDVLIASSGPITIGFPMIIGKVLRRKNTIFEVRDLWPAGGIEMGLIQKPWQQKLALWFEKLCYRCANTIVTASIGQKDHIKNRFPNKKIEVIPNASDLDLFGSTSQNGLPDFFVGKKLFTHIGSLGFIHNMHFWMEVAKSMKTIDSNGQIQFVFIGDGVDREFLEKRKEEWSLEHVHFLGLKPKAELPNWVQKSVATLFATLDNPVQNTCSPNKIFDSFAAGIPIVQTSSGWIFDLVENSQCGINVPLHSPKKTAQMMLELANDPIRAKKMGNNAKKLAEGPFNRDQLANNYLEYLQEL